MAACGKGNLSIVRFLIKNGADINSRDKDGYTAINWAHVGGDNRILYLLIDRM
ncbi:Hypothetical predicted protein [Mytilus galloprovincialis]|uniref:Uncharacterized protein n=1 Tax=Mytilus galloprovincialis TaxID=29158 RepID=A0A8B6DXF6_MYTGA|nr:Hypothetical predicted protein [Mytilus galloprovincialis]